jgi:CheY-like chemotaxis protein
MEIPGGISGISIARIGGRTGWVAGDQPAPATGRFCRGRGSRVASAAQHEDDRIVVRILVWSADGSLANLVTWNLEHRGFAVLRAAGAPCCEPLPPATPAPDVVIADLNCPEPRCWDGVSQLRERFGRQPLILLSHAWPPTHRLRAIQPYGYLKKPFAIEELLKILHQVLPVRS